MLDYANKLCQLPLGDNPARKLARFGFYFCVAEWIIRRAFEMDDQLRFAGPVGEFDGQPRGAVPAFFFDFVIPSRRILAISAAIFILQFPASKFAGSVGSK